MAITSTGAFSLSEPSLRVEGMQSGVKERAYSNTCLIGDFFTYSWGVDVATIPISDFFTCTGVNCSVNYRLITSDSNRILRSVILSKAPANAHFPLRSVGLREHLKKFDKIKSAAHRWTYGFTDPLTISPAGSMP